MEKLIKISDHLLNYYIERCIKLRFDSSLCAVLFGEDRGATSMTNNTDLQTPGMILIINLMHQFIQHTVDNRSKTYLNRSEELMFVMIEY